MITEIEILKASGQQFERHLYTVSVSNFIDLI
jgi:hypothetical protein